MHDRMLLGYVFPGFVGLANTALTRNLILLSDWGCGATCYNDHFDWHGALVPVGFVGSIQKRSQSTPLSSKL